MKRERPSPVPGGAAIFQRLYTRLGCRGRPPRFEVEFYPYANLMHTIRVREETACVRLSDALRRAPLAVLESAAAILLSRVYRPRGPPLRAAPARRVNPGPRGSVYDLAPIFTRLNRQYFSGRLHRPRLGWS